MAADFGGGRRTIIDLDLGGGRTLGDQRRAAELDLIAEIDFMVLAIEQTGVIDAAGEVIKHHDLDDSRDIEAGAIVRRKFLLDSMTGLPEKICIQGLGL